jgi:hypothetical protein
VKGTKKLASVGKGKGKERKTNGYNAQDSISAFFCCFQHLYRSVVCHWVRHLIRREYITFNSMGEERHIQESRKSNEDRENVEVGEEIEY